MVSQPYGSKLHIYRSKDIQSHLEYLKLVNRRQEINLWECKKKTYKWMEVQLHLLLILKLGEILHPSG